MSKSVQRRSMPASMTRLVRERLDTPDRGRGRGREGANLNAGDEVDHLIDRRINAVAERHMARCGLANWTMPEGT